MRKNNLLPVFKIIPFLLLRIRIRIRTQSKVVRIRNTGQQQLLELE